MLAATHVASPGQPNAGPFSRHQLVRNQKAGLCPPKKLHFEQLRPWRTISLALAQGAKFVELCEVSLRAISSLRDTRFYWLRPRSAHKKTALRTNSQSGFCFGFTKQSERTLCSRLPSCACCHAWSLQRLRGCMQRPIHRPNACASDDLSCRVPR